MKLTKEVNYKVSIKANLSDEGDLSVVLYASVPYGKREATATLNDFQPETLEKIRNVLEKVLKQEASRVIDLAENSAAQSRIAAVNLGEEI